MLISTLVTWRCSQRNHPSAWLCNLRSYVNIKNKFTSSLFQSDTVNKIAVENNTNKQDINKKQHLTTDCSRLNLCAIIGANELIHKIQKEITLTHLSL